MHCRVCAPHLTEYVLVNIQAWGMQSCTMARGCSTVRSVQGFLLLHYWEQLCFVVGFQLWCLHGSGGAVTLSMLMLLEQHGQWFGPNELGKEWRTLGTLPQLAPRQRSYPDLFIFHWFSDKL